MWNLIVRFFAVIGWVLTSTLIASTVASVAFVQSYFTLGFSRGPSTGIAIIVATVVYLYIWFQPNIKNFIEHKS